MKNQPIRQFPPIDPERAVVKAPISTVTLLEDRAMVHREGEVRLKKGHNRIVVTGIAPVAQDVSVRGEVSGDSARVTDSRIRRAMRATRAEKPEALQALEAEAEEIARAFEEAERGYALAERTADVVQEMIARGMDEIPEDAAWGQVHPKGWREVFGPMFERAREQQAAMLERSFDQEDEAEKMDKLARKHRVLARPDWCFVSWIEVDVLAEKAGKVRLSVDYVVPNALWRPLHTARLETSGAFTHDCAAAVWQHTGEDWTDVQLVFSTARSSLGIEPPLLHDDLLNAQRKAEEVVVAAREVEVQAASVSAGKPAGPATVDLPGVDDGGETRNLRATSITSVPSDGRPHFIPIFRFETKAEVERIAMPEQAPRVFLRSVQHNTATQPILAGPVALVRDHGHVGWTKTLFVAPGERFELGFGPDMDLRLSRHEKSEEEENPVDDWRHEITTVRVYLSNLGDEARTVSVTERIPVSEVDEVKIAIVDKKTSGKPSLDDNGFVKWEITLPPYEREIVRLDWKISLAPGVEGM